MTSLLVISHDVVGQRMAGPGIRVWEMARALANTVPVTLIAPRPIDLAPPLGVTCGQYTWGDAATLEPYLATASAVLANGFVAVAHPELLAYRGRLIIDLYDPVAFENLELFRQRPLAERQQVAERDATVLRHLLQRGDHFLCATERQRDLYVGGLLALGRITPTLVDADPLLRNLIDVVPFGVSDAPPQASGQPALRGAFDDLGPNHEIVLWSGGLWDWMDPQTLVKAMPQVLAAVPNARLVFLAGRHPGPVPEMAAPQQTRQLAAELGLLGKGIHFYEEWVPYERRADFLLEATVMVSLHREHLETRYAAVRSRVLDHLWVGKPSVLSAGDAAADLIVTHGAGEAVPVGDVDAVTAALTRLLTDPQRRAAQSASARALGQCLRWSQVVQPLVWMLSQPYHRAIPEVAKEYPLDMKDALQTILQERNELIKALETQWQISLMPLPASLVGRLWRAVTQRLAGSLEAKVSRTIDQQRTFNATLVNLIYRLASSFDEQTKRSNEQFLNIDHTMRVQHNNIAAHLASLTEQLAGLRPLTQMLHQELQVMRNELQVMRNELQVMRNELQQTQQEVILAHTNVQRIQDTLGPLHQHVIDLEQRILDLDDAHSVIVDKLNQLLTTDLV
ncbi:MAG: glycosyltransferase [Chloroflexus sp.]|nr:glycosyltransferase [Chloroflexus sp.]